MDLGPSGQMSWEQFKDQLENPQLEAYFRALDLDKSEAKGLFDLLDYEKCGTINAEEFINGCIRLSGPALSKDLVTLMFQVNQMWSEWDKSRDSVEETVTQIAKAVNARVPTAPSFAPLTPGVCTTHPHGPSQSR